MLSYWDEVLRSDPEERQQRLDDLLHTLSIPYLAVFGDPIPAEDRIHLHQHVPAAQIKEWPDNGHMVHLMQPGFTDPRSVQAAHMGQKSLKNRFELSKAA